MKPGKFKDRFEKMHKEFVSKGIEFVKRKECILKSSRLDSTSNLQKANVSCLEASYRITYRIIMNKKPHTIEEDLIKPCLGEAVKLVIGSNKRLR